MPTNSRRRITQAALQGKPTIGGKDSGRPMTGGRSFKPPTRGIGPLPTGGQKQMPFRGKKIAARKAKMKPLGIQPAAGNPNDRRYLSGGSKPAFAGAATRQRRGGRGNPAARAAVEAASK